MFFRAALSILVYMVYTDLLFCDAALPTTYAPTPPPAAYDTPPAARPSNLPPHLNSCIHCWRCLFFSGAGLGVKTAPRGGQWAMW